MKSIAITLTLLAFIVSGCSFMAGSKTKSESLQTAERFTAQSEATLRRAATGTQPQGVALEVKGKNNTVDFHLPAGIPYNSPPPAEEVEFTHNSGQKAGTDISWLTKSKWAIPLGVSMLLIVAALFGAVFFVKYLKRSSATANAALNLMDKKLADEIEELGKGMAKESDKAKIAEMAIAQGSKERERRRLRDKFKGRVEAPSQGL